MKKVVAWILTNNEGEVLLQKRTANYKRFPRGWTLMGGKIESGEEPIEAVKRELKEELGIALNLEFCDDFSYNYPEDKEYYLYLFKGNLNNLSEISLGEGNGIAFFSRKELEEMECLDKEIILKWM